MIWLPLLAMLAGTTPPVPDIPIDRIATPIPIPPAIPAAHRFGISIALAGEHLVVGADGRRDGPAAPGMVAVFRKGTGPGPSWRLDRLIQAPRPVSNDGFGTAVALDGGHLLIGAPGADDEVGAAWLVDLACKDGPLRRLSIANDLRPGDRLGESVSLAGGLAVIGAPRADTDGCIDRGRAWCLTLPPRGRMLGPPDARELEPGNSMTGMRFGSDAAIGESIAVGAPGADVVVDPFEPDSTVDRAGQVVMFELEAPHARRRTHHRSAAGPLDRTGTSLAWNADRLVVGSPRASCGRERGGVLTVFHGGRSELGLPCRIDGGVGGTLAAAAGRVVTGVPGRRDAEGRLDAAALVCSMEGHGLSPRVLLDGLGSAVVLDVAIDESGQRIAVAAARNHEDESVSGVVWIVEFAPPPAPVAFPATDSVTSTASE